MSQLALSIQQPWAWLIVTGHKDIENRTWPTNVRGRVLIHTGKKFDAPAYEWLRRSFPSIEMPPAVGFERGGIVGQARIVDCVEESDSLWFSGPYGFVLEDPHPLPFHPCPGKLGFFRVKVPS